MAAFSLKKYINYREGVDISGWLKKTTSQPTHQRPSDQQLRPRQRFELPGNSTDDLNKLVIVFQRNPRTLIRPTLDQLITELLELEKMYKVALLNPAVIDAGRLARENWKRAEQYWRMNLTEQGHAEAQESVYQQIKSLIGAYQTTAASKIVEAREFMEMSEWSVHPLLPLDIHKTARTFYKKGRDSQGSDKHSQARSYFMESIIDIERMYLESERLLKTQSEDEEGA